MPPEQKVGGSNPLGRTKFFIDLSAFTSKTYVQLCSRISLDWPLRLFFCQATMLREHPVQRIHRRAHTSRDLPHVTFSVWSGLLCRMAPCTFLTVAPVRCIQVAKVRRNAWNFRQVESKDRCSSSQPLWISGPPSSWITLRTSCSAATFLRGGSWFTSRMISLPSNQMLSTWFRMVLFDRPDPAEVKEEGHEVCDESSPWRKILFLAHPTLRSLRPFPWLAMIRETGGVVECSLRRALPRAHLTTPPVSRKIAEIRERGPGK